MEITEAITRERTICPICKEEFKLGGDAGKLPCGHFFCFECIHVWLNFDQNDTCPVCRRPFPSTNFRSPGIAVPPPPTVLDSPWEYFFFPPEPILTESHLVADETGSSSSPSIINSEAGYDTARDELDASHDHPQASLASSTPTTVFP
ncbi:E3 ubiquitin-protein ligase RNF126-like [Neltuma alba]|uniref:E3 ubiquitin-protein ligase RNF126-like n=1 Tax=Neltuma alba TaxID=207710 RepID=UPI0010A49F90|nr:E3 ubiquitin-protein ligase RNF126-like [Prosopis alba]